MKKLFIATLLVMATNSFAGVINCGQVKITTFLTGARHGAMARVDNRSCGAGGWICLDPNGEVLSKDESQRLFAYLLNKYNQNSSFNLHVFDNVFASSCNGPYPVVEDARDDYAY